MAETRPRHPRRDHAGRRAGGSREPAAEGADAGRPPRTAPATDAPASAEEGRRRAPPQDPKERRSRPARPAGRGSSGAATPRTPEERQAERDAERRARPPPARRRRARERDAGQGPARRPRRGHAPPRARRPGRPKVRQGIVTSDKADKTITVRIDAARRHRRYEKIVRSSTTLHAHDETNDAHKGDTVRVIESRPLSATKRWRLVEVLERAR